MMTGGTDTVTFLMPNFASIACLRLLLRHISSGRLVGLLGNAERHR